MVHTRYLAIGLEQLASRSRCISTPDATKPGIVISACQKWHVITNAITVVEMGHNCTTIAQAVLIILSE
jgi:hypothetical protein